MLTRRLWTTKYSETEAVETIVYTGTVQYTVCEEDPESKSQSPGFGMHWEGFEESSFLSGHGLGNFQILILF